MPPPHIVAVGSANPIKISALRAAANALLGAGVQVGSITVTSNTPEQPWGDAQTLNGAATRARMALAKFDGATIGVGIEAGLVDRDNGTIESMTWIVAIGSEGTPPLCGQSRTASYLLPDELARSVRASTLGHATRLLFPDTTASAGTVGPLTNGLLNRAGHYETAALLALIPFNPANSSLTFTSPNA